jgi:UDP-N-acetylmuramate: L-alanyl-gamma-D-glutamyl-meso-diaminopimelate ligase
MHNLALALHNKGYQVTGSDDAIFEPSKSRLDKREFCLRIKAGFRK